MKKLLQHFIPATILISFCLTFSSFESIENIKKIKPEIAKIKGKVQNYDSNYKTGQLTYFDAITRTPKTEVFAFDSLGNFDVSFRLTHEVYGCVNLKFANNYFDIFVEPQKTYNIIIKENSLIFTGSGNKIYDELTSFEMALSNELGEEIKAVKSAHNDNLSIDEYLSLQKKMEIRKLSFLKSYQTNHILNDTTVNLLTNKIKYQTAKSWINYRFDYSGSNPILRDSLPKDFYTKLFSEYPINTTDGYFVREYIDYISNIGTTMDDTKTASSSERIAFYKKFNYFTNDDLQLIAKAYLGDSITLKSSELKEFSKNDKKRMKEFEFRKRFRMHKIFLNGSKLPKGLGRDFVLSQQIAENYFENFYSPTETEWNLYENFFANKSILNYLRSICPNESRTIVLKNINTTNTPTDDYIKQTVDKYLNKYLGKVIYIDFWATWCGPCKQEIPFAKQLHIEFENKNVVFINFCVQSEKNIFDKMIVEQKISGINYLLNDDECNMLTKHFRVNGYPTYILIDKNGTIVDFSAPRPSSNELIKNKIISLLQ